ncbi:MAG: glycosyltransferase family 2 protein [Chloroflexales bacterium]
MSALSPTLVSVITICRHATNLIEPTMISVLQQTYPHIEYLIVDGGSTDTTLQIVQRIAERFPERTLRTISEPDQGIADAMNKGVKLANGELIIHLHAGDRFIDPQVIEQVVASYTQHGWRWGVAGSIVVSEQNAREHVYRPCSDYRVLLKKNCIPHQSTFLVRDIFTQHGLFSTDFKQAMDYEFWLRIAFRGHERPYALPFNTTYFLAGGRSSKITELLKYLVYTRYMLHQLIPTLSLGDDAIFLGRVLLFWYYAQLKSLLHQWNSSASLRWGAK